MYKIYVWNDVTVQKESTACLQIFCKQASKLRKLFYFYTLVTLKSLVFFFSKKLKYKGKSFKIEKLDLSLLKFKPRLTKKRVFKRGVDYFLFLHAKHLRAMKWFLFSFGHILKTRVNFKNIKIKLVKKTKYYYKYSNKLKTAALFNELVHIRFWNKYTQRGLRFGKQIVWKKTGKVSKYR